MKEISYSEEAVKQLKKIRRGDKILAIKILKKIEQYASFPNSISDIKNLKGKYAEFKRIRVGDYRIIFDENHNVIFIYKIKHRKEAYK